MRYLIILTTKDHEEYQVGETDQYDSACEMVSIWGDKEKYKNKKIIKVSLKEI